MKKLSFKNGIIDGLPICFGYFAVSFAFGIYAFSSGLDLLQCVLLSGTNVTSAGQFAAVPIITGLGTLAELTVSQFVINLRYSLMSIALSQRLDSGMGLLQRLIVAFINTDEVFAVSMSKNELLNKEYLYGLILTPWFGWTFGTFLGAWAGNVLPTLVTGALGIAIYAMFVAIVVPPSKKSKAITGCALLSLMLSCVFNYWQLLSKIPDGFVIIICAVVSSAIFALIAPIEEKETECEL